jgi:alcohol dehydrogenase (NADP+)
MLQFAAENGISPWTERRTMKECNRAVVDMAFGRARYRYVLFNEDVQSTGPEGAEA